VALDTEQVAAGRADRCLLIQLAAVASVLEVAFHRVVSEPTIEAGYERFAALTGGAASHDAYCLAVAACMRDGLIREPIPLPEGALQCRRHLELTPKGVATARSVAEISGNKRSVQESCTLASIQKNSRPQDSQPEPRSTPVTEAGA